MSLSGGDRFSQESCSALVDGLQASLFPFHISQRCFFRWHSGLITWLSRFSRYIWASRGRAGLRCPFRRWNCLLCLTNLLRTVAPSILSGNRVQQLRSDAATNVFHRNSKWKHQLFWTMNMHSVLRLAFPCTERYPCPMKLPKHQTTLHLDAPIDCAMGLLSLFETVAPTPILLTEWQCVVDAMFSRLITCALSCMLIWKTRTDIWCARTQ